MGETQNENLVLSSQDINFDEMEQDIERFANEPSVREVLEVGVDLQNYSSTISKELAIAEKDSVGDYVKQVEATKTLCKEIKVCDSSLEAMENVLMLFKDSIGQLSSDIFALQAKSQTITIKLSNRKNLENQLGFFTNNISVSRQFINHILNGEVGPNYIEYVRELQSKLEFSRSDIAKHSHSCQEVQEVLNTLKLKASDNIRQWLITRINELRDHYDTEQVAIQTILLKSQYLYSFLKNNSPDFEQSIRQYYTSIMSRIYHANFKLLSQRIIRQMNPISTNNETIAPFIQKGFFSSKVLSADSTTFFSIGERIKILNEIMSPPQPFGNEIYPVELLLRSFYQTLIDTVISEYNFSSVFFEEKEIISNIFSSTFKYLDAFMNNLLIKITDPICIILLLRIINKQKEFITLDNLNRLETHLNTLQFKLSDKFKLIILNNINIIKACDASMFNDYFKVASFVQRFSDLCFSLILIQDESIFDLINQNLLNLNDEIITLIEKSANNFQSEELKLIFLINNYYHIASKLSEVKNNNKTVLFNVYEQKITEKTASFVEMQLVSGFGNLLNVVKKAFPKLESSDSPLKINVSENELKNIANDFKEKHTKILKEISDMQIKRFCDFVNGREIMKLIAKRIVLYWAKFEQLCKYSARNAPWISNMISVRQLVSNIQALTPY